MARNASSFIYTESTPETRAADSWSISSPYDYQRATTTEGEILNLAIPTRVRWIDTFTQWADDVDFAPTPENVPVSITFNGSTFTIRTEYNGNYRVNWGDGTPIEDYNLGGTTTISHSYPSLDSWTIVIYPNEVDSFKLSLTNAEAAKITAFNLDRGLGPIGLNLDSNQDAAYANFTNITWFPAFDTRTCTSFVGTWLGDTSLADFPAGVFDETLATDFTLAFRDTALTGTSIENIVVSLCCANQTDGTLDLSGGTSASFDSWTALGGEAYQHLVNFKNWNISANGNPEDLVEIIAGSTPTLNFQFGATESLTSTNP